MSTVAPGLTGVPEAARSEQHAGLLRITPQLLGALLKLPPGVEIVDLHRSDWPDSYHALLVLVGPALPEVRPGELAREVEAIYETDADGTVRLTSLTELKR